MPLPQVPGWLIDYATARDALSNGSAKLKASLVAMCGAGNLRYCACEKESFKSNALTADPFYKKQNCCCNLTLDIVGIASALPNSIGAKRVHPKDESARMIVACALHHNFGIVSSKTGIFLSPVDLGIHVGLNSLSLEDFAALL